MVRHIEDSSPSERVSRSNLLQEVNERSQSHKTRAATTSRKAWATSVEERVL